MSYCELCGKEITGKSFVIEIDSVVMKVCWPCSKHGKPYEPQKLKRKPEEFRFRLPTVRSDYSKVIKEARKKLDLSEEELGSKIEEDSSVVKLLEQGKFKPDPTMARKIENSLGIKLVVEGSETIE
jgi:putative transcription factor